MGEYQRCKGNPKRMAQVVQRIVPDKAHLQKVLAVFRADLLKQGAPLIEFYNLMAELNTLMGADQSYKEFLQAGQDLGVTPDELLRELQAESEAGRPAHRAGQRGPPRARRVRRGPGPEPHRLRGEGRGRHRRAHRQEPQGGRASSAPCSTRWRRR